MPYIARRAMTIAGTRYGPGEAVPVELLSRNTLSACLNLGRIAFSQGAAQHVAGRSMVVDGHKYLPGDEVPTGSIPPRNLRGAIDQGRIVPVVDGKEQVRSGPRPGMRRAAALLHQARENPNARLADLETEVRRRRPPRRVQAAPAAGSN